MRTRSFALRLALSGFSVLLLLTGLSLPLVAGASPLRGDDNALVLPDSRTMQDAPGVPLRVDSTRHSSIATQPQGSPELVCVASRTGSATNPVVFIEVAPSAVPAHERRGDDVVGVAPCPLSARVGALER